MSPKEPEPILRPSRYLFPTRSSMGAPGPLLDEEAAHTADTGGATEDEGGGVRASVRLSGRSPPAGGVRSRGGPQPQPPGRCYARRAILRPWPGGGGRGSRGRAEGAGTGARRRPLERTIARSPPSMRRRGARRRRMRRIRRRAEGHPVRCPLVARRPSPAEPTPSPVDSSSAAALFFRDGAQGRARETDARRSASPSTVRTRRQRDRYCVSRFVGRVT